MFATDCSNLIGSTYSTLANQALTSRRSLAVQLLQQGKLPKSGWDNQTIELCLQELSCMDSNNFVGNVGVGEREGRIYSELVAQRHFRMSHGIGRSGDVSSVQPKAAGSSLLNKLANALVTDAIRTAGIRSCQKAIVVPVATGMALTLCLLYFKRQRPPDASYVIWPRIDQKSCYKCMLTAGLTPIVITPILVGDELETNLEMTESVIKEKGADRIVCVMSTTSCFAPRAPDKIVEIAKLCKQFNIPHLVNNAYGLQSSKCCHLIQEGNRVGRLDLFVQSCDKNFMVPVGGAIVAGFHPDIVDAVSKSYPGRASATPSIDLFITLVSMGSDGYLELLRERKEVFDYFKLKLTDFCDKTSGGGGLKLLNTRRNLISLAVALDEEVLVSSTKNGDSRRSITEIGSRLFTKHCSGARVVPKGEVKVVEGCEFQGFGGHCDNYPCSYLNVAAAIGMRKFDEVDSFLRKLKEVLQKL